MTLPGPNGQQDSKQVLALLWHAPQRVITAGGFRRTYEIFKRTPPGIHVLALDDAPSFLNDIAGEDISVSEYKIPGPIRALEKNFFWYERICEWMAATLLMSWACVKLAIRRQKFDVIFVPSSEQLPALIAGIVGKHVLRCRLVACNLNIEIFPRFLRRPVTLLHNFADVVIVISQHLASELRSYGLKAPVQLNTVGLDTSDIERTPMPADKSFDAVFVGRHDTEKGVFDLISIWGRVVRSMPDAKLAMVGSSNPTNRQKIESRIASLGIEGNVDILGTVDDPTKYSTIKGSKVCVFPSYVEEWGIVPQEALACGLPVIAYDLPVYHENIQPCEAVFRQAIGDIDGMAEAVIELLSDERYSRYSMAGPAFVRKFDWETVAEREFEIMLPGLGAAGRGQPAGEKAG